MQLVIKLGGSILFDSDGELDLSLIDKWLDILVDLTQYAKVIVVVGGGYPARRYITWGRRLGLSEFECDELGIHVSRLNAYLLLAALRQQTKNTTIRIYGSIPTTPGEIYEARDNYDIIFVGGFIPGQSTIGVAAEVAEASQADFLVVATDVNGIYDRDPKKFPDAQKLDEVAIDNLISAFSKREEHAGTYSLFDIQALKLIKRSRIPTIIFNGRNIHTAKKLFRAMIRGDLQQIRKLATIITHRNQNKNKREKHRKL